MLKFIDYFKLIRKIEDEGMSDNFEKEDFSLVINNVVTEPLFNYITLNNFDNKYDHIFETLKQSSKEMLSSNKKPLLYLPYIRESKNLIDALTKKYYSIISKDSFLIFEDKSFLTKDIVCPGQIELCECFDGKAYAEAVYKNFNSLITKYDLYGGLEEEYVPGIINSFTKIKGLIKRHYIAKDNDKIISTLTISIDEDTMIGGLANASTLGDYRGQHIGIKLLQYALNDCFKKGMKNVFFYTEKNNISELVYSKCGFKKKFENYMLEPTLSFESILNIKNLKEEDLLK